MNFGMVFRGICAAFLVSWGGLVFLPWLQVGSLLPLTTMVDDKEVLSPWDVPNLAHAGEKVYGSEGCAYCHTQQVRDGSAGADFIRGWAVAPSIDPDAKEKTITRRSFPRDYIWRGHVYLGTNRTGADLTNVGGRFPDEQAFYRELYDPYILSPNSAMPAYKYLFSVKQITGKPSEDALDLNKMSESDAPPAGYEIVPTAQGRALAAYLLSLRNGYDLTQDEN